MSIFGRRPNPEEVATQLIEGLENGSLTLNGEPESVSVASAAALPADRLAKTVEAQLGAVLGPLQPHFTALAEHAAAVLKSAEETRRRAEAEAAAVLAEARAVLSEANQGGPNLRAKIKELIVQMGSEPIVFDPNGAILKGVIGGGKTVITGFEEVKSFKSDPSDPKAKFRDT